VWGGIERGERNVGVKALFSIARGLRIGAAELFRAAETGG
jgi:transcriptional regulator with XRE-family HTH domain